MLNASRSPIKNHPFPLFDNVYQSRSSHFSHPAILFVSVCFFHSSCQCIFLLPGSASIIIRGTELLVSCSHIISRVITLDLYHKCINDIECFYCGLFLPRLRAKYKRSGFPHLHVYMSIFDQLIAPNFRQ